MKLPEESSLCRCRWTSPGLVPGPVVVPGLSGLLLQGCIRKPPFDALTLVLLNTDENREVRPGWKGVFFCVCVAEERLLKSETAKETPFRPRAETTVLTGGMENSLQLHWPLTHREVFRMECFGVPSFIGTEMSCFVGEEQLFRAAR